MASAPPNAIPSGNVGDTAPTPLDDVAHFSSTDDREDMSLYEERLVEAPASLVSRFDKVIRAEEVDANGDGVADHVRQVFCNHNLCWRHLP